MALTDFEKSCIDDIFASLTPKDRRRPSAEQETSMAAIKHGTEAERQALITNYINDTGLTKVAAEISACDEQIAHLQSAKTDLQAKQTAMQNYVA